MPIIEFMGQAVSRYERKPLANRAFFALTRQGNAL